MRSIIEEIAAAEQQAEDIRASAASEGRERIAKANDEAEQAMASLEAAEREAMKAALAQAELGGEAVARDMAAHMEAEAEAQCKAAEQRLPEAVAYLMKRVQKLA